MIVTIPDRDWERLKVGRELLADYIENPEYLIELVHASVELRNSIRDSRFISQKTTGRFFDAVEKFEKCEQMLMRQWGQNADLQ